MKHFVRLNIAIITFIALFFTLVIESGCATKKAPEPVIVAVSQQPLSAPVYIAYEEGYFRDEGLAVTLQPFWAGKDAFQSVLDGKAQIATVAETPIAFARLAGKKFLFWPP